VLEGAHSPRAGATVIDVRAPSTLAGALATAKAGDRIVFARGQLRERDDLEPQVRARPSSSRRPRATPS
jgi:hypothetical protein